MIPRFVTLVVTTVFATGSLGNAHDLWINQGGYRNTAGEWCCGSGDCFVVPKDDVSTSGAGYILRGYGEVVPYNETQPSPDGAFWRCKRADGTRRCFFAPPPNS
jgi:hypothetical protein